MIREELIDVRDTYGDERRTEIIASQQDLSDEDLITEEELVVTISHQGYAKTQPLDTYQAQRRGGRGKAATSVKDEDFVEHLVITNRIIHYYVSPTKVRFIGCGYSNPQGSRGAKGGL